MPIESASPVASMFNSFYMTIGLGVIGLLGTGFGFYCLQKYNKLRSLGSLIVVAGICRDKKLFMGMMEDVNGRLIPFPITISNENKALVKNDKKVLVVTPMMAPEPQCRMKLTQGVDVYMYPMPGSFPMSITGAGALMDIVEDVIHGDQDYSALLNDVKLIELFFTDAGELDEAIRDFVSTLYKAGRNNGMKLYEIFPTALLPDGMLGDEPEEEEEDEEAGEEEIEIEEAGSEPENETYSPSDYFTSPDEEEPIQEEVKEEKPKQNTRKKFGLGKKFKLGGGKDEE